MWHSIVDLGLHSNCDVVEISEAWQLCCSCKESGGGGSHTGCDLRGLIKRGLHCISGNSFVKTICVTHKIINVK